MSKRAGPVALGSGARIEKAVKIYEVIVERSFRFIEMTIVTSLIGVASAVISPGLSGWLVTGLSLAAGLYFAMPAAQWLATRFEAPKQTLLFNFVLPFTASLMIAALAVRLTVGVQVIITTTFQIDEARARVEYQIWQARNAISDCPREPGPGLGPPPPANPECISRHQARIQSLIEERQRLRAR